MKRGVFLFFALVMLVAWAGFALAQQQESYLLENFVEDECGDSGEDFLPANGGQQVLLFPYLTNADGWWGGFALLNTGAVEGQNNIEAKTLCLVGVDEDGNGAGKLLSSNLYAGQMYVDLVSRIDEDDVWQGRVFMGVYAQNGAPDAVKNENGDEILKGFAMLGDGSQGVGYFALNMADDNVQNLIGNGPGVQPPAQVGEAKSVNDLGKPMLVANSVGYATLRFDYLAISSRGSSGAIGTDAADVGGAWWSGLSLFNNSDADAYAHIQVIQEDGKSVDAVVEVPEGQMVSGMLEDLVPDLDPTKRARVVVDAYDGDDPEEDNEVKALFGFTMFGDGNQGMGYLGNADEEIDL
jgi:hypothetical protein